MRKTVTKVTPQTFSQMGDQAIQRLDENVSDLKLSRDAALTTITGQIMDMGETVQKMREDAETAGKLRDLYAQRQSDLLTAAEAMEKTITALKGIVEVK